MVMLLMSFSNIPKKKRKEENNIFFLYIIYVLLAFHVMIHFSLRVCVWFLSTFQYPPPPQKKKKLTIDLFSMYALFF